MRPGWNGYRYVSEDEIEDARIETLADSMDLERCWNCDYEWDIGLHSATRTDPAYADSPECPRCGCHPDERPDDADE